MNADLKSTLLRQFETAWKLTEFHLDGLSTEECLWRPAQAGPHVARQSDGRWIADWPTHEGYDLGPPSIAWVTWHIVFWWSMVLDHSTANGTLTREAVPWPGDADELRRCIRDLRARWLALLQSLDDASLSATRQSQWPFNDRPFADVVAWVNVELTKNAAEIGYARFLHSVATHRA